MSNWSRMSSTDEQEEAINDLEDWMKKAGVVNRRGDPGFVGGTTIGKHPQTVILDLHYQGSDFYISRNGNIELNDEKIRNFSEFKKQISVNAKRYGCKSGEFFKNGECKKMKG